MLSPLRVSVIVSGPRCATAPVRVQLPRLQSACSLAPSSSVPFRCFPRGFSQQQRVRGSLSLQSSVCMLPHPDKKAKGGEDAYFISKDGFALGVADGVGGWSSEGVDPSIYSRALMINACKAYEELGKTDPLECLKYAAKNNESIIGSATASLAILDGGRLRSCNLGDSGILVIDKEAQGVLFKSSSQQHQFNFPYQLGTSGDPVESSDVAEIDVKEGQLILLATDGLLDNIFEFEILKLLQENQGANNLAQILAERAHINAASLTKDSPFAAEARRQYMDFDGGKMDDITVIVARVIQKVGAKL